MTRRIFIFFKLSPFAFPLSPLFSKLIIIVPSLFWWGFSPLT
jgi:hypothetical protein